jgi:hypothetical protein
LAISISSGREGGETVSNAEGEVSHKELKRGTKDQERGGEEKKTCGG